MSSFGDTSIKHDSIPDTSARHTAQVHESDNCLDVDINIQVMVITELMSGVELALRDHQVLTVRDVLEVYKSWMKEFGQTDDRDYKSLPKMMVRKVEKYIPDVCLDYSAPNQSQ